VEAYDKEAEKRFYSLGTNLVEDEKKLVCSGLGGVGGEEYIFMFIFGKVYI